MISDEQLVTERAEQIVKIVNESGKISVEKLSRILQVSESTIRRELVQLSEEGRIGRFHGGAVALQGTCPEPPITQRFKTSKIEKESIGKAAAELVNAGDTIALFGGTTVSYMCKHLRGKENVKVITNSLLLLDELKNIEGLEVISLGGLLNRDELSFNGYLTSLCIKQLRADKAFLGIRGMDPSYGLMAGSISEAEIYKAFIEISKEVIIVADNTKINDIGTVVVAPISDVDVLITDKGISKTDVGDLVRHGVKVVVSEF